MTDAPQGADFFRQPLREMIDLRHPLAVLAIRFDRTNPLLVEQRVVQTHAEPSGEVSIATARLPQGPHGGPFPTRRLGRKIVGDAQQRFQRIARSCLPRQALAHEANSMLSRMACSPNRRR